MKVAVIREADCVGCTKCLAPCPVDAIVGAPQFLHSVLKDECIGCGLCVAPCPMDCIEMVEKSVTHNSDASTTEAIQSQEKQALAENAKRRYAAKKLRLLREAPLQLSSQPQTPEMKRQIQEKILSEIQAALQRVQIKRRENPLERKETL